MLKFLLLICLFVNAEESALERTLFTECDIRKALEMPPLTPMDYTLKYFLFSTFASNQDAAIANILAADLNDPTVMLLVTRAFSGADSPLKIPVRVNVKMQMQVCTPIAKDYFNNPYNFYSHELLDMRTATDVHDVITTVWSLNREVVDRFLYFIGRRIIQIKDVIKELEYLCEHKVPSAFGILGDAYFYGLGVDQDMDKALEYYWAGRDLGSIKCYTGIGRVLISDDHTDLNGADAAFDVSILHEGHPEALYCKHLIHLKEPALPNSLKQPDNSSTLYNSAVKGYLPAVHDYAVKQAYSDDPLTILPSILSFLSISKYSPLLSVIEEKARNAYYKGNYKQALLYYLYLCMFNLDTALKNAAHIMSERKVFNEDYINEEDLLIWVYENLAVSNPKYFKALGDIYYSRKNLAGKAFAYYISASNHSNEALYSVAYMYETGKGVPKDLSLAYRYLNNEIRNKKCYLVVFYGKLRIVLRMILGSHCFSMAIAACIVLSSFFLLRSRIKKN